MKASVRNAWMEATLAEIASGTVSKGKIRVLRQRIGRALSRWPGDAVLTDADACALIDAIETHKPFVSAKQAREGADWLYAQTFTKSGTIRNTENARQLAPYADDIRNAHQSKLPLFRLLSFDLAGPRGECPIPCYALWRAQGGRAFAYSYGSWQSGIGLDVRP